MPRTKGGGIGYTIGSPVNDIEKFLPSLIPDLVLWIKSDDKFLLKESVQSYCNKQSYFVKEALMNQFSNSLKYKVITEIKSDTIAPNSLIPLNLDTAIATVFPTFRSVPGELDAINMSNYKEPITGKIHNLELITSRPVKMEENASSYSISYGIIIGQNTITNQIQISANFIDNPVVDEADPTRPPELTPNNSILAADVKPTAEFSEIIIFSRRLTLEENAKMEGYLAYKQNTQYALPVGHPYLPNMLTDLIFSTIAPKLLDLETSLRQQITNINVATNDYINERGSSGPVLDSPNHILTIQTALNKIANFIPILSKGFLYAKKINNLSLDAIYKAIHDNKWSDITNESITEFINSSTKIISQSDAFITSLQKKYLQPFVKQAQSGGSISTYTDNNQPFYTTIKATAAQIQIDGLIAYNSLESLLISSITNNVETIVHQWLDIQSIDTSLKNLFKPIEISITSGDWLTPLKLDKSYDKNNGTYNDPTLNVIETYYKFVSTHMKSGDYAFILQDFKEINDIFFTFSNKKLNPIYKATYINYLGHLVKKAEIYYEKFKEISEYYTKILNNINSFIAVAKETGQPSTFTDKTVSEYTYNDVTDIYIRKVIPLDETLFGIEYVETNSNGLIVSVKPFFIPSSYKFTNSQYVKETPYLIDGSGVNITYHIIEPLKQSVYNGLTDNEKTPLYLHKLTSLMEIPRYQMNGIHCFDAVGSVEPILLPEQIKIGSWCLIYNVGDSAITVRSPENFVDLIGPDSGILYICIKKTTLYGSYMWDKNNLSYDTVLMCPRTAHCMYIDEIGVSIYIKPNKTGYEPAYTVDGFLSEVIRASDTNIYDIDDVFLLNPYTVTTVSVDKRTSLTFNPSKKKMVKVAPPVFKIFQDDVTGFAVLFNENGGICVNQYGFAKAIKTPIQQIGGVLKAGGAYGDLILEPTSAVFTCPYDFEPFLKFNDLFTTSIVAQASGKNVYVTNTLSPIVNPHGIVIEVPTSPTITHEIRTNLPIGIYVQPIPPNTYIDRLKVIYESAKDYIQHEINLVIKYEPEIKTFSDASTICTDAKAKYQSYLTTLLTNDSVFKTNMAPSTMEAVKTSIGKTLEEFLKEHKNVDKTIEVYKSGVDKIKSVTDSVAYWNSDGAASIDSTVKAINQRGQEILQQFQTTSIPDLTELLTNCSDALADFNDTLKFCVNYVKNIPVLISEVDNWYAIIHPKLELLKSLRNDVVSIQGELPKIVSDYQTKNIYDGLNTKVQALFSSVQKLWSQIHDKKTAIDTYLQDPNKLSPDQYTTLQSQIGKLEEQIIAGDNTFNSLYKQIKAPPTEQFYNSILEFQKKVIQIQKDFPNIV